MPGSVVSARENLAGIVGNVSAGGDGREELLAVLSPESAPDKPDAIMLGWFVPATLSGGGPDRVELS
jgi:hypothetical protein